MQPTPLSAPWWHNAVVYQVYLRSFRDSDGDGIGDLEGLRQGLETIADPGVDAIWINPCYVSPQHDHGYDVANYRQVDPAYGTNDDLRAVIGQAHQLGLKVLLDLVPNHCSDQHVWFQQAINSPAGSPERARFHFRDQPNNWQSVFGGPAWSRAAADPTGQWYLHLFDSTQPDFNWANPEVAREFADVLGFWFDAGADGFRIDVAHGLAKASGLPDWPCSGGHPGAPDAHQVAWDQPPVHAIYTGWRQIARRYRPERYLVGEVWVTSYQAQAAYTRRDELHQTFDFDLLIKPWDAAEVRDGIGQYLAKGEAAALVASNHDVHRPATRFGLLDQTAGPPSWDLAAGARRVGPVDQALGRRRALAMTGLLLALPGTIYLYQGDELGLPEVLDLPPAARQDPIWRRSGGADLGRDGCRVPLPWTAKGTNFGFSPSGGLAPWLPQPASFGALARDVQEADPESHLGINRRLLRCRRIVFGAERSIGWLESPDAGLLAFTRGAGVCVVNFGDEPVRLPHQWPLGEVAVATDSANTATVVAANSATWFGLVQ
ncbi:MAG: glycoside hydrolase family 13 protein [Micrococcales bacterium]|nr:glycoside hydrolase family 13 protein [Micrococcales bacterium]